VLGAGAGVWPCCWTFVVTTEDALDVFVTSCTRGTVGG
jgi:hypothetical protein